MASKRKNQAGWVLVAVWMLACLLLGFVAVEDRKDRKYQFDLRSDDYSRNESTTTHQELLNEALDK